VSIQRDQSAELRFVVTNTLIVGDIGRSVAFYRDVLGTFPAPMRSYELDNSA
jgi:hypothetical protein